MSTVVCGTDLSEASLEVERAAAALARLLDARLELFHVVQIPPFLGPDFLDEEVVRDLRQCAEGLLAKRAVQLEGTGLTVTTTARVGTPDELWHHARDMDAAALVIGTHARTGLARFVIGSFAERTLTATPCPLLIVPPHAIGRLVGAIPLAGPARFVVGVDGSPASDAALAWTMAVRDRSPCDIHLLHLFSPAREQARLGFQPAEPFEVDPELVAVLAREVGNRVLTRTGEALPLRIRPNWGGEEDPLAWEAETDDADLLVIGTSQARRSSARATVRGSRLPVLCVPRRGGHSARAEAPAVHSLLVVVDFSAPKTFVARACRQLMPDGGSVVLMNVVAPTSTENGEIDQDELETVLLGLMPVDDGDPYRARTHVTTNRSRADAVLKAVNRFAPDLVVMAAPAKSGRASVEAIEQIVQRSPKPVVVFPSRPSAADA